MEIGFQIVGRRDARKYIGKKVPVQMQFWFKSFEGAKIHRAITSYLDVTDNIELVEKSIHIQ